MSPGDDDARLRAALVEAHRRDGAETPEFERLWSAGRRRTPRRSGWRWAAVWAGLAAAALGVWIAARPRPAPGWPVTGTRWIGPTDFLLQTPDLMTLRTLPPVDPAADPWTAAPPSRRGVP